MLNLIPNEIVITQNNKGNRRWYEVVGDPRVEGLQMRNVSTICNIINKPGLMYWMKGQIYKNVAKVLSEPLNSLLTPEQIVEMAEKMPNEGTVKADIGTEIHAVLEHLLDNECDIPAGFEPHCANVKQYLEDEHLIPVATEMAIYHPDLWYGGTVDLVAVHEDGGLEILDYKTGKKYDEHTLQLSAYAVAVEELSGIKVRGARSLLIDPDSGVVTPHKVSSITKSFAAFVGAMELDKWQSDKEKWMED